MTKPIAASEIAAAIKRRHANVDGPVAIYWIAVSDSRTEFADEVNEQLRGFPAAAVVVRGARFEHPNAIFEDFSSLVREEREILERELHEAHSGDTCAILLVARSELRLSQASSPVPLPDWFPVAGGTTVTGCIEDLSWTADAPLSSDSARIDELCRLLFELDAALLETLEARIDDARSLQPLFDRLRVENESLSELIEGARSQRDGVLNASAYRPSVRERGIVPRLWSLVQREKPEGLTGAVSGLQRALGIPDGLDLLWHETLVAVMARPTNRDPNDGARFVRNILLTLRASAQMITAAAHADAYRPYPIMLMRSTSHDLRRGLADAIQVLRCL